MGAGREEGPADHGGDGGQGQGPAQHPGGVDGVADDCRGAGLVARTAAFTGRGLGLLQSVYLLWLHMIVYH